MGLIAKKKLKGKDKPLRLGGGHSDSGGSGGIWLQSTILQIHQLNGVDFSESKFENWDFTDPLKLDKGEVIS